MRTRIELHEELCALLGSRQVYFRAPESVKMSYPAIVYDRTNYRNDHANDDIYRQMKAYTITVIDKNPDSELPDKVMRLPFCRFDRHYVAENLNHDVFTLYY